MGKAKGFNGQRYRSNSELPLLYGRCCMVAAAAVCTRIMKYRKTFCLEGQFAGFEAGGKSPFKYLRLETATGDHSIKLSKDLRLMLFRYLVVGDRLRVAGYQKNDRQTGEVKLKAVDVVRLGTVDSVVEGAVAKPKPLATLDAPQKKRQKPARILVCNKSSCRKRGSDAVCRAIAQTLTQLALTDVDLKTTGCMDRCKAGPNLVMMPDKAKYTRVSPNQIPKLVQQHYGHEIATTDV